MGERVQRLAQLIAGIALSKYNDPNSCSRSRRGNWSIGYHQRIGLCSRHLDNSREFAGSRNSGNGELRQCLFIPSALRDESERRRGLFGRRLERKLYRAYRHNRNRDTGRRNQDELSVRAVGGYDGLTWHG